jgi:hypothetical protein
LLVLLVDSYSLYLDTLMSISRAHIISTVSRCISAKFDNYLRCWNASLKPVLWR